MSDIKIGDIVMWYETQHSARKTGQVYGINGDMADIYCSAESAVYKKPLSELKKVK